MAFARKNLNDGEELIVDLRPHWIFLAPSTSALAAGVIIGLWVIIGTHGTVRTSLGVVVGVGVLVVLIWFAIRYAKWLTTEFAVTNQRVIARSGVLNKQGKYIPLERINSVDINRSLLERMLGAGDLSIESASEGGRQVFEDIRRPEQVQSEIHSQIRANSRYGNAPVAGAAPPVQPTVPVPGAAAPPTSVADQLTKLDELRRSGALSEAEFQAQKARLLGG